jgi:hypothetical protein
MSDGYQKYQKQKDPPKRTYSPSGNSTLEELIRQKVGFKPEELQTGTSKSKSQKQAAVVPE